MSSQSQTRSQVFPFTKCEKFAVVKKQPRSMRHRCDFKYLHETREAAEAEALRLTDIHKTKFYIIEIVAITSSIDAELEEMPDKSPVEQERTMAHMTEIYSKAENGG